MAAGAFTAQLADLNLEPGHGEFSLRDFITNFAYQAKALEQEPDCEPDFTMIASGDTTLDGLYTEFCEGVTSSHCTHIYAEPLEGRYWTVKGYIFTDDENDDT